MGAEYPTPKTYGEFVNLIGNMRADDHDAATPFRDAVWAIHPRAHAFAPNRREDEDARWEVEYPGGLTFGWTEREAWEAAARELGLEVK